MTGNNMSRGVSTLLVLSAVLLGILVPGGPIETRDFSHISPVILGAFNTFLASLGIGSFVFAYFALKGKRWAKVPIGIKRPPKTKFRIFQGRQTRLLQNHEI